MGYRVVESADVARGLMLLGVLHIHALVASIDHLGDTPNGRWAYAQVKLLAPHVAVFFALAGMSSRSLGAKPWPVVLQRSLMLLLLAWLSHVGGVLLQHLLWTPWPAPLALAKTLVKPMVLGIGHSTFVPWFLVVLAVTRLLAYALARGGGWFFGAVAVAAVFVLAARAADLTDNFHDWKRWPAALLMFVVGMRMPTTWRVPHLLGVASLAGTVALTAVNRPGLWREGVCLDCDLMFIAQPMLGEFGLAPVYFVQQALGLVFLLWLAQCLSTTRVQPLLASIGRQAIPLLVLHGWVILSFYGLAYWLLQREVGPWLFIAIFVVNTGLHLLLRRWLAAPLGAAVGACSTAAHALTRAVRWVVWRPSPPRAAR